MALEAIVTDIETLPEHLRSEYVEKDGKFVLDVKSVDGWDLQDIAGLTNSLKAERNLKTNAEKALAAFKDLDAATARQAIATLAELGDITPAEAKSLKAEVARLQAVDPKAKADEIVKSQLDAQKAELEKIFGTEKSVWTTERDAVVAANETLKGQLKALLVDNQIKAELGKVQLVSGLQPAAEMLLQRSIVIQEVDGKLQPVVVDAAGQPREKLEGTSLVPLKVADLVEELKTTMPGLFQAEVKGGTGITPSSGPAAAIAGVKNPWAKETLNRTEQVILTRTKPELAAQLKRAAGVE